METNPYEPPLQASAPPAAPRGKTVSLPRGPITVPQEGLCPKCGVYSHNIKALWVLHKAYSVIVFWWVKRQVYVACPRCMRKILWRRCVANVLTGNVVWLFYSVPQTIIADLQTRLGPKRRFPEMLASFLVMLWILLMMVVFFGVVPALIRAWNP